MVKVLLVSRDFKHPDRGGVVNYVEILYTYLKNNDYDIDHFVQGFRKNFRCRLFLPFVYFFQLFEFRKILKKDRPEIIHLNPSLTYISIIRDFLFLKIAYKNSIPTLFFLRGWRKNISKKFQSKFLHSYFKKNFKRATKIVVLAKQFKEELIKLGIDSEKIITSSTMVESDFYFPEKKTFEKPYTILYCGNMVKYKGIYELLESIPKVLEKETNINFIFMGDGPELKNLKSKTKEKGIEEYVTFTGYKSGKEKYDIFKKSHIFVLPSYTEGFPNVVLEAMAAGLPIITTPVGGLNDAIKDENGFILKSNPPDPYEISNTILKMIKNPDMMNQMSKCNIREAKEKYDVKVVTKEIENIYLEINKKL